MALSTAAKNGMITTIKSLMNRLYLFKGTSTLDNDISGYTSSFAGYTSAGDRYVAISWGTTSGGSATTSNSASSTPIMFAVPSGTTLTQIVYVDSATGKIVAQYPASGSYSIDGCYYISSETISFA